MIEFVDLMQGRSVSIDNQKDEEKFWFSEQWLMEPVQFGVRFQCVVDDKGDFCFHGKKKNYKKEYNLDNAQELIRDLKSFHLPKNTLFEGYLSFDNDPKEVYKFLNSNELNTEKLNLFVTDIIYNDSKDVFNLPLFDRKKILSSLFSDTKYITVQKGYVKEKKKVFETSKDKIKTFLFKDLEALYSFNQTVSCRIYKCPVSYFMVVLDYIENNDNEKFKNMIVALEGGQLKNNELVSIMNVPVHGNNSRISLYKTRDVLKGQVFELLAAEKQEDEEKYQEARFLQMRLDKTENDCVFQKKEKKMAFLKTGSPQPIKIAQCLCENCKNEEVVFLVKGKMICKTCKEKLEIEEKQE